MCQADTSSSRIRGASGRGAASCLDGARSLVSWAVSLQSVWYSAADLALLLQGWSGTTPPGELTRCDACYFLEQPGEVVRKLEAQQARGFADIIPLHQQAFADVDDIGVNVMDGSGALTEQVSAISYDVFLGTLSRVINSFITRDKALRGTLCNSTIINIGFFCILLFYSYLCFMLYKIFKSK